MQINHASSIYKKSERQVTPHATMSAAVRRVVDGESLRIISREFEIPRSTLSRYVSVYKQDETAILEANFKKAQIFSDEQEQTFVDYLIKTSDMFYGLTITGTRQLAYMLAKTIIYTQELDRFRNCRIRLATRFFNTTPQTLRASTRGNFSCQGCSLQ